MLVLSRLEEESVIITVGETKIRILVMEVKNGLHPRRVRLGFDAPGYVKINREEVQEKIDAPDNIP